MKTSNLRFFHYLHQLRTHLNTGGAVVNQAADESPLRAELFSADQLEQHGERLAAGHKVIQVRLPDQLLARLAENEEVLMNVRDQLTTAVKANLQITPASEWLLDNYYLIEEQIRTAKRHLPPGYSRELPRLASGSSSGLPRVYDIALEIISHGDGRVDPESLNRFVAAYQAVSLLKLGELWAIPIMLRLALIENLRRVAVRIAAGRADRDLAAGWVERMMAVAEKDPKSLVLVIADMARSNPPMTVPFVSEFTRCLHGHGLALALPLIWIEQVLAEQGLAVEQLVRLGNQQQAADQVSISNSIGSLRFLGNMDWRGFVETMSAVDKILRDDPAGIYSEMDFATRDRYRHVIEKVAKASSLSETEVAEHAIQFARMAQATGQPGAERASHVGFYLIGHGLNALEKQAKIHFSAARQLTKIGLSYPLASYLGAIALLTLFFSANLLAIMEAQEMAYGLLILIGILILIASSQLSLVLVNWLTTLLVRPHPLSRLDLSKGIPAQSRTLVIVPTMLTSLQNVDELVEALEVRFLANRDDNLHFGLLSDYRDAHAEILDEDDALVQWAKKRIEALNDKYSAKNNDIFFLFHRPRPGHVPPTPLAQKSAHPYGKLMRRLTQRRPALDAAIQLRPIPEQRQQRQLVMPGNVKGIDPIRQQPQRTREQIENRHVLLPVLRQPRQNLDHVRGMPERVEIISDRQMCFLRLRPGDDVQLTPLGQHQLGAAEILQMRPQPAQRPPRPFGDDPQLAVLPRIKRENAVRLPEVHPRQHDRITSIQAICRAAARRFGFSAGCWLLHVRDVALALSIE